MSLFQSIIKEALDDQKLLELERAGFPACFGRILKESRNLICIEQVNEDGEFDGIVLLRKFDITYVGFGGNGRDSIEKLVAVRPNSIRTELIDLDSLESAIRGLSTIFGHVALYQEEFSEDFYLGELLDLDSEFIKLREYGTRKSLDRSISLIKLETVTRVEAGGIYERNTISLFEV